MTNPTKTQLLLVALWLAQSVAVAAATRVALVSTCGGEAGKDVLALAEAQLGKDPEIERVERTKVELVLQEQNLWRCGPTDIRQALAAGKLLGVEVFAALESYPGQQTGWGLVCFDAASGARLSDVTVPAGPAAAALSVVATVREACAKRRPGRQDVHTVCLLSVRNADLPREMDSFCESVGRLVERRLLGSPDLTVLERQRLESVNKERTLPTSTPASELTASLILVDVEVSRGEAGQQLKAVALLNNSAGERLGKAQASAEQRNAADLADALATALVKSLQATAVPAAKTDRAREADRFRQEAKFLAGHNEYQHALEATEAAVALSPTQTVIQCELAQALFVVAQGLLQPGANAPNHGALPAPAERLEQSLRLANRCEDLSIEIWKQAGSWAQRDPFAGYLWQVISINAGQTDETRRRELELQRRHRALLMEFNRSLLKTVHDGTSLLRYTESISWGLSKELTYVASTAADWTHDYGLVLSEWMKLADQYPVEPRPADDPAFHHDWFPQTGSTVNRFLARPMSMNAPGLPGLWSMKPADHVPWRPLFAAMEAHREPVLQIYGRIGRLWVDEHATGMNTNEIIDRVREIVRFAGTKLADPAVPSSNPVRIGWYLAALDATEQIPDCGAGQEPRFQLFGELLDVMLQRREIAWCVVKRATAPTFCGFEQYGQFADHFPYSWHTHPAKFAAEMSNRWNRVAALLADPNCPLLDTTRDRIRQAAENKVVTPWTDSRVLFDPGMHGWERIAAVAVDGDTVFAVACGRDRPGTNDAAGGKFLQLVRIPLAGGPVTRLGKARYAWREDFYMQPRVCPTLCQDRETVFYAQRNSGIFGFRKNAETVDHLSTADGLPSDWVQGLAIADGVLYAGLGEEKGEPVEGYIIRYDLAHRQVRVFASSKRREKLSPLDDLASPFRVLHLRPDPARHRVLAIVDGGNNWHLPQAGLWQFDPETGEFKRLVQWLGPCHWASQIRDGRFLFALQYWNYEIVSFNLLRDEAHIRYTNNEDRKRLKLDADEQTANTPFRTHAPYLLVDGWLWSVDPFGRISADGQIREMFPGSGPGGPYYEWVYLDQVGDGRQVLACDGRKLWLLSLPEKEAEK